MLEEIKNYRQKQKNKIIFPKTPLVTIYIYIELNFYSPGFRRKFYVEVTLFPQREPPLPEVFLLSRRFILLETIFPWEAGTPLLTGLAWDRHRNPEKEKMADFIE